MEIRLFNDYHHNKYLKIDPDKICHQLFVGNSGSGKSFTGSYSLAKIIKYSSNAELYFLDYKGDDNFKIYQNYERYFKYKECERGLDLFHKRLIARLEGKDMSRSRLILFSDELNSFLNSYPQKKEREAQQTKLAECLAMGRSMSISVICCLQRADADFFKNGARENFMLKVGLMNLSSESRRMIFPGSEINFLPCNKGFGYASVEGNEPIRIGIPIINRPDLIQAEIIKALTNNTE